MQKVLVTGANGFLGVYLVRLLLLKNFQVFSTGKGPCRIPFTSHRLKYFPASLENDAEVRHLLQQVQPDIIIHGAAMSKPDECELNREAAYNTNVKGTENLLQHAHAYQSHFIYVSTDFVFNGKKGMYTENDSPDPVNYYGETKWMAEKEVMNYPHGWAIARTVMVYGKPFLNRSNLVTSCAAALAKRTQLKIFSDQIRTPTYVEDLAMGIFLIVEKKATGIYHLSGDEVMSLYQMICSVAAFLQLDGGLITPIQENDLEQPARRPLKTGFDISRARNDLGYQPVSFESGLTQTFNGFFTHAFPGE